MISNCICALLFMFASLFGRKCFSGHKEIYIKLIPRLIGSQMFDNSAHRDTTHQAKISSGVNVENTF